MMTFNGMFNFFTQHNALSVIQPLRIIIKVEKHMKEPTGTDLLRKLIDLYAEQEGVKITYQIEKRKKTA